MIPKQSFCFCDIVFTFFFLVYIVLHTLASSTLNYCRHDLRDALLEFKHEFLVNEHSLSSWNKTSIDCCSWKGVTCDVKSGKVISVNLDSIPLNNSFKPNTSLFKLQDLQSLSLFNCSLYGEIPSSLGNLSHLKHLVLGYNNLVGQLPDSIGNLTQLSYLDLFRNKLSGNIPDSIGNLTQLSDLYLGENKFSGNIPVSFASLTKLSFLDISNNQFRGEIFCNKLENLTSLSYLRITANQFNSTLLDDMSIFHKLEYFYVDINSFSGPFPASLFMIPSLIEVSLRGNQFKGPVEFRNTSSSSKLMYLSLRQNKFYGPIPKSISKFPSLIFLHLSENSFTGSFPKSVLKLPNLNDLDLSNNRFEGEIPFWLGSVSSLTLSHNSFSSFEKSLEVSDVTQIFELDLSSNSFRGPLPHWICNLRQIMLLDLSNNNFNGSIPVCLRNTLENMIELRMHNNNFSGILLPDIFVNATNLVSLDISGNQLEGELPRSLINCSNLLVLNVGNNRIKDTFPSWLGSMLLLQVLIIRSNKFYGLLYDDRDPHVSIGFLKVKVIDISHNVFTGTLPPFYFSYWLEMTTLTQQDEDSSMYLRARTYNFQDVSMELVNKGVNMEFKRIREDFKAIDFSRNKLSGKIPDSIGLLKELRLLNLSGNAFTSNIPQSLANLKNLEALDLSQNQLSGRIPPELGSLSFLSSMNFSHNNLEGPIPRGTQFERLNCSVFMDNPRLNGLEDICGETHVSDPTPQESEDLSEQEEEVISWIAAGIAYGPCVFCGLVIGHIFASHKHEWLMEKFGLNKWRAPITFGSTH